MSQHYALSSYALTCALLNAMQQVSEPPPEAPAGLFSSLFPTQISRHVFQGKEPYSGETQAIHGNEGQTKPYAGQTTTKTRSLFQGGSLPKSSGAVDARSRKPHIRRCLVGVPLVPPEDRNDNEQQTRRLSADKRISEEPTKHELTKQHTEQTTITAKVRRNHLSNTTCQTHVFFKHCAYFSKLN